MYLQNLVDIRIILCPETGILICLRRNSRPGKTRPTSETTRFLTLENSKVFVS